MRGMGQWASGRESWGPSWDPPRKKKNLITKPGRNLKAYLQTCRAKLCTMDNLNRKSQQQF